MFLHIQRQSLHQLPCNYPHIGTMRFNAQTRCPIFRCFGNTPIKWDDRNTFLRFLRSKFSHINDPEHSILLIGTFCALRALRLLLPGCLRLAGGHLLDLRIIFASLPFPIHRPRRLHLLATSRMPSTERPAAASVLRCAGRPRIPRHPEARFSEYRVFFLLSFLAN